MSISTLEFPQAIPLPSSAKPVRAIGAVSDNADRTGLEVLSDEELIVRSRHRAGEAGRECLAILCQRYYPKVARWCLRVCGDVDQAADAAQEVFLRVNERLDSFRMDSRFSTWLYTVTRRVAINHSSAASRHRSLSAYPEQQPEPQSLDFPVDEIGAGSQIAERLRQAMRDDLDPLEARVLFLRQVHGLTLLVITKHLDLTNKSGAKAYLVAAQRKLRRRFGRWVESPVVEESTNMGEKMSLRSGLHDAYAMTPADCPPPERLHRLALRDLGREQGSHLQEHLNDCPACTAEHDVAVLFESTSTADINASEVAEIVARLEQASPVRIAAGRRHARRRDRGRDRVRAWFDWARALPGWQLAAAAAFVTVLTVSTWQRPPTLPPAYDTTLRGNTVRTMSPQGDVGVFPTQLAWHPYSQATTYRVRLLMVDNTVLWEGLIADPKIDLPAVVGKQLQPMVRYVWTVEALNEAGALMAASQPQSFRIRTIDTLAPQGR